MDHPRMRDIVITISLLLSIFVAIPFVAILVLRIRDRLSYHRTQEQIQANSKRFRERLQAPKLDDVSAHFGGRLPAAFHELYSNMDELMQSDIEVIRPCVIHP